MCGIVGFVGRRDLSMLTAMCRQLSHRGPDGEGFYENEDAGVHFGHRRLAIIDIAGGTQPMYSADRSLVITYNGEIYNHAALRRDLEARGHKFVTDHSDTEVLIHGYREWGDDLPSRLNGMFAFAIHDTRRRRLFLARDRFGEKPLYYFRRNDRFAFASELSALTRFSPATTDIDQRSLQKLFGYGYLPGATALYKNCNKLPAGSCLSLDLPTGECKVTTYWRFRIESDEALTINDDDRLAEELRSLLQQATSNRMIGDVPVGFFLSGGLDSSAVLATAALSSDRSLLKTFTMGFDEQSFDESAYAKQVAEMIGTQHAAKVLSLEKASEAIGAVLGHLDEPLGDASILPTFLLAEFTRKHVTVALSGDGGDELFAGYDPFKALRPAAIYDRTVSAPLHRLIRSAAERLPVSHTNMSFDFKLRRALQGLSYKNSFWNPVWMSPVEPLRMSEFFENPLPIEELYSEADELWADGEKRGLDEVDRTIEFFTNIYLTDNILTKSDRSSMAHSLEARSVFLDNDLVDFSARLPHRFKIRNGERKYLLKKAMEPLLPANIIRRRKKGFGIPLSKWMKKVPAVVPMTPVMGMNMPMVKRAWEAHRDGRRDERFFAWNWLSLQAVIARAPADYPVARSNLLEATNAG